MCDRTCANCIHHGTGCVMDHGPDWAACSGYSSGLRIPRRLTRGPVPVLPDLPPKPPWDVAEAVSAWIQNEDSTTKETR